MHSSEKHADSRLLVMAAALRLYVRFNLNMGLWINRGVGFPGHQTPLFPKIVVTITPAYYESAREKLQLRPIGNYTG